MRLGPIGVSCPSCGGLKSTVRDSSRSEHGASRRRVCACGHRFTTVEIAMPEQHVVLSPKGEIRPLAPITIEPRTAFDLLPPAEAVQ